MAKLKFSLVVALAPNRNLELKDSLKNLDYPKNKYELIVERGTNPSENRNRGIKKSKGEIIAFIDDDAIVSKYLLKNAEEFLKEHKDIEIVGGTQLTPKTDNFFAKISGYVLENPFGTYKMSNRYKKGKLNLDADESSITSAICFVRKEVFKKIKGFNPILYPGEDPEFFGRAKKKGIKIAYNPNLIVYHKRRSTPFGFCKQIFRYGRVRMLKEKLNKTKINPVFLMPAGFTLYFLFLPALISIHKIFLIPIIIYFSIVILVSLIISLRKNLLALPFLPIIFFLLHFSYGLGMLSYFISKK